MSQGGKGSNTSTRRRRRRIEHCRSQRSVAVSGCVVLAAKSGEEGLRIAASRQPDIILLDVKMPGIDGYQAARYSERKRTDK